MGKALLSVVGRRLPGMRRSGIWREFTERNGGWQASRYARPAKRGSGSPHERTGARPRGPVKRPSARDARAAAGADSEVSVRSPRRRRVVHHGLMYWNSDRFCNCA
ncbi:hypothetical protein DF030_09445 [Burkholderia cenocepacia]|nr:hypothetical protein DF030_09445 [Burkholderia cenocepacia]